MAIKKAVSFKESEVELIKFVNSKRSFSNYVKDLIEKNMKEIKRPNSQQNEFELDF